MKSKQREKWAKTRSKGKLRFILVYGVLFLGVSSAILSSIIKAIYYNNFSLQTFTSPEFLVNLVCLLVGGYFWGHIVWNFNEKEYLKR